MLRLLKFFRPLSAAASAFMQAACPPHPVYRLPSVLRPLSAVLGLLFLVPALRAQTVRWDPPGGALAVGQVTQLSLVFENCEPSGGIAPPAAPGLEFGQPSRGENNSISFVNGRVTSSRTITLAFPARAAAGQSAITIPAFEVETDKGRQRVAAASFTVGAATVGNTGVALDSIMRSHFTAPDSVWAGEVFPLAYTLDILERYPFYLDGRPEWNPSPLAAEDGLTDNTKREGMRAVRGGDTYSTVTYRTRASTKTPGPLPLPPVRQIVNLQTGSQPFGFFAQPTVQQFSVVTQPATLTVKPLPAPAPPGFNGAVGDFRLAAKVVPANAAVGEPVTWTVTLEGTGNWPDIAGLPPRDVSRDFRTVSPQAKRAYAESKLFDATLAEDIVLIPTKPGTYTLGPVTMACFDPKTGQYKILTTEKFTVTITGGAPASAPNNNFPLAGNSASVSAPAIPPSAIQTPQSPAGIPRDPLPAAPPAATPLSARALLLCLLSPVLCPLGLWLALALRRAKATDPLRPQREARARLAATLASLAATSDREPTLALLHAWRRDTAALWQLPGAEPNGTGLENPGWAALWAEADRTLFGAKIPLPTDWLPRAEAALAASPLPPFRPLRLFLPRNLFPFAFALLLSSFILHPSSFAASSADASYRATDFPAAEKAWRATLAAAPADWAAHHNLSLALAQQSRWPESAGHALAAFAQQPQSPAVRWQLALALKNAGYLPDAARPFFANDTPGPRAALALRLAPASWQRAAILAALLAAAALALLLWRAYHVRAHWLAPVAWAALACATLLGAASVSSLRLYGPLADARAVVIWQSGVLRSIPTEADTTQKTAPLAPGLIALDEGQPFLDWRHLAFPNGQTGWVRQEELVRLW